MNAADFLYSRDARLPVASAMHLVPEWLHEPPPWAQHIPFAFWIMEVHRPSIVVELGTHWANSYFAFCQAVAALDLPASCYAVDTWRGDDHAGHYGEEAYEAVARYNEDRYAAFSTLVRTTFDEAQPHFADASIDLLHIDGLHTYEACRHDFETWLPKLSERAVVLFHDTNVRERDFGVFRLWSELITRYPHFEFPHGHGLGVLGVGKDLDGPLAELFAADRNPSMAARVRHIFWRLGSSLALQMSRDTLEGDLASNSQQLELAHEAKRRLEVRCNKLEALVVGKRDEALAAGTRSEALEQNNSILDAALREACDQSARTSAALAERELELSKLTSRLDETTERSARLSADLAEREQEISRLTAALSDASAVNARVRADLSERDRRLSQLEKELDESLARTAQLALNVDSQETRLRGMEKEYANLLQVHDESQRALIEHFRTSTSWRVTAPLRYLKSLFKNPGATDSSGPGATRLAAAAAQPQSPPETGTFLIVTPPHTLFIAEMIRDCLQAEHYQPTIALDADGWRNFEHCLVLCPQWFATLPANYMVFQMEQSIADHWFTPDYFTILRRASAILDYSIHNIRYMIENGLDSQKIYFVPLSFNSEHLPADPAAAARQASQDNYVLFYGDTSCPRRTRILDELRKHFNVRILTNTFGDELVPQMRGAKCIINVHFYDNALLETTRIYQILSYAIPVVSETSFDIDDHKILHDLVDFVPVGDTGAMVAAIQRMLTEPGYREDRIKRIAETVQSTPNKFQFYMRRFLLGRNMISQQGAIERASHFMPLDAEEPKICLTLPETPRRTSSFLQQDLPEFKLWYGLRASPGWVGCALSYKALFTTLRDRGFPSATVCEDDVLIDASFRERFDVVRRYLGQREGEWDLFAGFIADVHPETEVLDVEEFDGVTFLHITKTVSMVFNVYSRGVIEYLADWDLAGGCIETNTIDRYLERRQPNRVVTTFPFLVSHRPDLHSTIWECSNEHYSPLIDKSAQILKEKIDAFRKGQGAKDSAGPATAWNGGARSSEGGRTDRG